MALYLVGDIQGCFDELQLLLQQVDFGSDDTLWLTGDLVARGPKSLKTLRWVKQQPNVHTVLGNHDLHLLAVAEGIKPAKAKDKIDSILTAKDRDELMQWLRQQPLLMRHPDFPIVMTHAGIYPRWSVEQADMLAQEVSQQLRGKHYLSLLQAMYGDSPAIWSYQLIGPERWRFVINALTRMRFCHPNGTLELNTKVSPEHADELLTPWFELHHQHQCNSHNYVFGHWASLMGKTNESRYIALDTGCVWGNELTMLCWQSGKYFKQQMLS
ncbi:symmetrical bis(5'-nucleosyl)-tetraphosphatase [Neiella marina]|uniref:bis(5'-nucleosyl)-tetraphosphatase (symmetrical) n=1 Tax=Neiella holothuriorum TaxID=2870530 RepID=A0ABS7EIY1_9GAMM|nr:symmetrical bis(5'-nucleosyl)-tetraphosphatase [Neiella holothuriorum]MBW8192313.1 symmetrical bis(5'-nucleosyl)-tetraphosphatase [Neiella holothuriorum]